MQRRPCAEPCAPEAHLVSLSSPSAPALGRCTLCGVSRPLANLTLVAFELWCPECCHALAQEAIEHPQLTSAEACPEPAWGATAAVTRAE